VVAVEHIHEAIAEHGIDEFEITHLGAGPQMSAVLEVTPSEAIEVASLIEKHVRIREASNFEARLRALEERIGNGDVK
jgi:hypothetical protein